MTWEHLITADIHDYRIFTATSSSTYLQRSTNIARSGTYSFKMGCGYAADWWCNLTVESAATKYVAMAISRDSDTSDFWIRFREGTTDHISLKPHHDGYIYVYRGSSTLLGSFAYDLMTMTLLDCKIVIDDSSGEFTVKASNGDTLFTYSGDTRNGGTAGEIDNIYWFSDTSPGNAGATLYVDDLAVRTDDYCGAGGNHVLAVTADGADTGWTASAGDDYECVDDAAPASFTDYIETSVGASTKATFEIADLGFTPSSIDVLAVYAWAQLAAGGSASLQAIVNSNSTYGTGDSVGVDANPLWVKGFFTLDPDTDDAWTESGVNAAQIGIQTV